MRSRGIRNTICKSERERERERETERQRDREREIVYYSQALSPLSQTKYTCTHFEYHGYRHVILKV